MKVSVELFQVSFNQLTLLNFATDFKRGSMENSPKPIPRGPVYLDLFYLVLKHLVLISHIQNIRALECSCEELEPLHSNEPFLDPRKMTAFLVYLKYLISPGDFSRLEPGWFHLKEQSINYMHMSFRFHFVILFWGTRVKILKFVDFCGLKNSMFLWGISNQRYPQLQFTKLNFSV